MEFEGKERRDGARARRPKPRRLSEVFTAIAAEATGPVSIGSIVDALGDRSFAALLLFFAAINLLPLPPGATLVLGLPLVLVSAQMAWGSKKAWMPRAVRDKALTADQFRAIAAWLAPRLTRLERLIQPRYWPFWRKQGERVVGVVALLLAVVVTLPIPLGNWLPAFAISLLALALSERDGVLFWVGIAIGIAAVLVIALVVGSAAVIFKVLWAHAGSLF